MDGLGVEIDVSLVIVRAIHFASTAMVVGALIFRTVVTEPVSTSADGLAVREQARRIATISLAIAVASAAVFLPLQAANMSGQSLPAAMTTEVLSTVMTETQFGVVLTVRLLLSIILFGCLAYDHIAMSRWLGLMSALGLVAAIAWTGHAGAGIGAWGKLHVAADVLHLIAAAAWIGGLVSLVLLFVTVRRGGYVRMSLAREATGRFSTLGIASVGTLISTGAVNTWLLVGSWHALVATDYGGLLILKVGLFTLMVLTAALNRFWLTPRLAARCDIEQQQSALFQITWTSSSEIALGGGIYGIVGALGMLHPAIHSL
jgi:putative copper resistance protein D